jgi:FtsP/CotA-like multicopper oxidase with cupredoxin domain
MARKQLLRRMMFGSLFLLLLAALPAGAQSFRVQCPSSTRLHPNGFSDLNHPGTIKCQEISGGDGYATMADGHQIFLFGFGPLSGLNQIQNGIEGTVRFDVFNNYYNNSILPNGNPDPTYDPNRPASVDGAIANPAEIMNIGVMNANAPAPAMAFDEDDEFFLTLTNVGMIMRPDLFEQHTVHFHGYPNATSYFDGVPDASVAINIGGSFTYYYTAPDAGTYFWHCHITPPEHLQMGMVGQLWVRPRQNRAAVNDLFVKPPCLNFGSHVDIQCTTPPASLPAAHQVNDVFGKPSKYAYNDSDGSTRYDVEYPIQMMGFDPNFHFVGMTFNPEQFVDMKDKYFLLSGRGYPDTVGVPGATDGQGKTYLPTTTVNPDGVNGTHAISTEASDAVSRPSQPMATLIDIPAGGRALLRIADLSVTELSTLATIGVPMHVIALDARLLRDMKGNNLYYTTNSITIGGGQSLDVILDPSADGVQPGTYFLYSTNLDHLSNDAENFGGSMAEIIVH